MGNNIPNRAISKHEIIKLESKANWVRKKVLEMAVRAGAGHVASSFSCVEILVSLYQGDILRVNPKDPAWPERDRFILSKGHAALALYAVLADFGFFSLSDLDSFSEDGSLLGTHPEDAVSGIEALTGSLGHGLPIGAGIALGAKLDKRKYLTVVLMGDGECHEGTTWEAAMFAAHHKLNNLVAIVDYNGLSATGFLKNYLEIKPLKKKWESFGWETTVVEGHFFNKLLPVLKMPISEVSNRPLAMIASTIKGKGISFMENSPIWHYRVPVGKELERACKELALGETNIYEKMG